MPRSPVQRVGKVFVLPLHSPRARRYEAVCSPRIPQTDSQSGEAVESKGKGQLQAKCLYCSFSWNDF